MDQFSDVPLTFKDISDIKTIFKKSLSNIYHVKDCLSLKETIH